MQESRRAGRAHPATRMSRGARVARGSLGAVVATLFAAASHGLAGGEISVIAVAATTILALPLCVALAGRVDSLWRLALAVSASQFLYHWSFAGIGVGTGGGPAEPLPAHAAHYAALTGFVPAVAGAGSANALMWCAHGVAAAVTILLLHRGERASLALARLIRRALPLGHLLQGMPAPLRPASRPLSSERPRTHRALHSVSAISHRGPPALHA